MHMLLQDAQRYVLRFETGEDVIAGIIQFAQQEGVDAAHFTVIGAAKEVVLSYYNLHTKQYEDHMVHEDVEIASVVGNVALLDGKPIVHAHGTFGKQDFSVVGGHVKKLVVSATGEVCLDRLFGQLHRSFDEPTGLNLLQ